MFRSVVFIAATLAGVGAASADDVFSCRALGAASPVLGFTIVHANDTYSIADATFQLDAMSYSTSATDPSSLATVTGINLDNQVTFTLQNGGADVVVVNLVTRFEGGGDNATGNARVGASRILVLRCDVTR